jgi:DNA invertase Pin-like site-specific DNA recombinase
MRDTTVTAPQFKMTVAYLRSATVGQIGGSMSLSRQRRMCEDYARQHGLQIDAVYTDAGVSAMSYDRPALNQLMRDLSRGYIRWVVAPELAVLAKSPELVLCINDQVRRQQAKIALACDNGLTPLL